MTGQDPAFPNDARDDATPDTELGDDAERPGSQAIFEARLPLVLASASPRRRDLLASVGLDFEIMAVDGEPEPEPGESPEDYAMRAARAKAEAAAALRPEAVVLAADTVVVATDEGDAEEVILGKPAHETEAMMMLARLAGNTHRVVTGCCLVMPCTGPRTGSGEVAGRPATGAPPGPETFCADTEVEMDPQPLAALMAYVATGEPMGKAGAYAIQGKGAFLVRRVRGSYTNVVGLPLAMVLERLQALGAVCARGA